MAGFVGLDAVPSRIEDFCSNFVDASLYRSAGNAKALGELRDSFPQAMEFDEAIQPLLENRPGGATEAALAVYHRQATQARMLEIAIPALSRLSRKLSP